MSNKLTAFIEEQEVMNNLGQTLSKLYEGDTTFDDALDLHQLTEKTYEVMTHIQSVQDGLLEDPGVALTAGRFDSTIEDVTSNIIEVMLMSTIARQMLYIKSLTDKES